MPRTRSKLLAVCLLAAVAIATVTTGTANPFRGSGFQLGEGDAALLDAASRKLYLSEEVELNAVEAWENPETGNRGTVTLIEIFEHQGMPCRRLRHDIELRRTRDPFRFIVDRCKTSEGEWKILTR